MKLSTIAISRVRGRRAHRPRFDRPADARHGSGLLGRLLGRPAAGRRQRILLTIDALSRGFFDRDQVADMLARLLEYLQAIRVLVIRVLVGRIL